MTIGYRLLFNAMLEAFTLLSNSCVPELGE